MINKKLKLSSVALLFFLLFFAAAIQADMGSGVRVSLLQKEIVGATQSTINFEVSNINPVGSADISEVKISLPGEFVVQSNLIFSNIGIKTGETKQFSFEAKAPNLNANADYIIEFAVSFADGSISKRKETLTVLADRVAPISILINIKNASYFNSKPIKFEFDAIDVAPSSGISKLDLDINGMATQIVSAGNKFNFEFNPASDSPYKISYRASDNAGNTESAKEITIFYDTTAPFVEILSMPAIISNPTPQISFKFSDQFATYSSCVVSVLGYSEKVLAVANSINSVTLPKLADGNYTAEVSCSDFANNVGKSTQLQFAIDTKPPSIININPSNKTSLSENQPITIQFDKEVSIEDLQKLLVLLDGNKALNLNISTEDNKTFLISPTKGLEKGKDYKLVVDENLSDAAGNKLNSSYLIDYNTGSPTGFATLQRSPTVRGALVGLALISVFIFLYYRKRNYNRIAPEQRQL